MLLPTTTVGSGDATFTVNRSADVTTMVVAVLESLPGVGSVVALAAVAVLDMTVAAGVPELTFTTTWKVAVSPAATVPFEKTTLPVPPTTGDAVPQPVPNVTEDETNVVFAGTASVTVTVCASLGPLLMKLMV